MSSLFYNHILAHMCACACTYITFYNLIEISAMFCVFTYH